MATEHCPDCNPGPISKWKENQCNNGHLYIKEFGPGYVEKYPSRKKYKACLYVGSTGKTVEQRHDENWTKYNTDSARNIREFCDRNSTTYRYDLIRKDRFRNPIELDVKRDPGKLERWEADLAGNLENRGYWVDGGKKKAKSKD